MTAKGKRPPNAGKGRKKGVPNKITADLRSMILGALEDAGGQQYLVTQSRDNPNAFLALVGKCVPKDVNLDATASVLYQVVTGVPANDG